MDIKQIKYDCKYFKGDIPCVPNKLRGKVCDSCDEYSKNGEIKPSKKILIIKLGALGDVIRTTPLLIKFKKLYPDSHISWITAYPDILPKNQIDNILKPDYNSVLFIQNSFFDIAVNLDKDKEACFLLKIASASEKYGFSWSDDNHIIGLSKAAEEKILTGLFDSYSKSNTKSYQQEIFEICGLKFNGEPNLLDVNKEYSEKWKTLKDKSAGKPVIGLNTGCGKRWITRMWPENYWMTLIKTLQDSGYYPVLLGGEDEDQLNKKYSAGTGAYYPGHFTLDEFIAIINNCDVIVSGVSMAMHIASGLGKPMVLFNNIFNKNEFELYGRGIIIEPAAGCDCYYGSKCNRQRHCMMDIDPQLVFDAIGKLAEKN